MTIPHIQTKVVHSRSKSAWNIIGITAGSKFKIARVPYLTSSDERLTTTERAEALIHAEFISWCFNNSTSIISKI